jgi:hypothetical protein
MTKILRPPGDTPRVVAPTTTSQLAKRMLAASTVAATMLPAGFYSAPALDILLALHAAEDDAHYPAAADVTVPGLNSSDLIDRWLGLLIDSRLIEQRAGLIALTPLGHDTIVGLIERIFDVQRSLDSPGMP